MGQRRKERFTIRREIDNDRRSGFFFIEENGMFY